MLALDGRGLGVALLRGLVVLGRAWVGGAYAPRAGAPSRVQHRVPDSLRCHAVRELEARRPVTFGGPGDGADRPASRAAMRVTSAEPEQSLVRGLLARALWTAARVPGRRMREHSACPKCGAAHVHEVHVLWDCPEWESPAPCGAHGCKMQRPLSRSWGRPASGRHAYAGLG